MREIDVDRVVSADPFRVLAFIRRQYSLKSSNSRDARFQIPCRVRPTQRKRNTIIHTDVAIGAISSLCIKNLIFSNQDFSRAPRHRSYSSEQP